MKEKKGKKMKEMHLFNSNYIQFSFSKVISARVHDLNEKMLLYESLYEAEIYLNI